MDDKTLRQLRELNFGKATDPNFKSVFVLDLPDPGSYSYLEYRDKYNCEHPIKGGCLSCEENNINPVGNEYSNSLVNYSLRSIAHGATSYDLFQANNMEIPTDWHPETRVMFIFDNPSSINHRDPNRYHKSVQGYPKWFVKNWYWVMPNLNQPEYPEHFEFRKYEQFVFSVMHTFKLSEVYITNCIKCGLGSEDLKGFENSSKYNPMCAENCMTNFLEKEIEIFKPNIIFAMGVNVYYWLTMYNYGSPAITIQKKWESIFIVQLLHPGPQNQLHYTPEKYKKMQFMMIAASLFKAGVISQDELRELYRKYI
jgi:hypothetical protein